MNKISLLTVCLTLLLSPLPSIRAAANNSHTNPLIAAIDDADHSAVKAALHQGANINASATGTKETPLMVAIHALARECKSNGSLFDKIFRTLGLAAFIGGSYLTIRYTIDYVASKKNTQSATPQTGFMIIDGQPYKFCPTNPNSKAPSTLPTFVTLTIRNVGYDFRKLEQPAKSAHSTSDTVYQMLQCLSLTVLGLKLYIEESTTCQSGKAIIATLLEDPKLDLKATNATGQTALTIVRDYIKSSSSKLLAKSMKEVEAQILAIEKSRN